MQLSWLWLAVYLLCWSFESTLQIVLQSLPSSAPVSCKRSQLKFISVRKTDSPSVNVVKATHQTHSCPLSFSHSDWAFCSYNSSINLSDTWKDIFNSSVKIIITLKELFQLWKFQWRQVTAFKSGSRAHYKSYRTWTIKLERDVRR